MNHTHQFRQRLQDVSMTGLKWVKNFINELKLLLVEFCEFLLFDIKIRFGKIKTVPIICEEKRWKNNRES